MKIIHADELTEIIGPKAVIGLGNACGEPQTLIEALIEGRDAIEHIEIYGMIHFWTDQIIKKNLENKLKLNPFMMNRYTVEGFQKGFADYIPCRYSKFPELFHKGHVPLDAALISVSSPDSEGNCTYGVSSDYAWPWRKMTKSSP